MVSTDYVAVIVAIVRQDLKDEVVASYRWTDDELERHISHAVKDYSLSCPLEVIAELDTVTGTREIDISSLTDRIGIEAVEYPIGLTPVRYQRFAVWSDTLTLIGEEIPDGSHCNVYYTTLHTLSTSATTIPVKHEDLVAGGAAGYAAMAWGVYSSNRVNTGGEGTAKDFLDWGREKLADFRVDVRKLGRKNTVRVNSLYTPYYRPVSQTTDPGP